jgi:hypothetical protein
MIGGTDIILKARDEQSAIDVAMRVIRLLWKNAVFEDADTGETFISYYEMELHGCPEILVYRDAPAQRRWKEIGPDPGVDGTMIHLIGRRGELTIGLDDVPSHEMRALVDSITHSLRSELFASTAVRKVAA